MMKDTAGIVQIYGISPNGGQHRQITFNNFSVETGFNVSPNGKFLAYGNRQRVYVTQIQAGETRQVSPEPQENMAELRAINWSNSGNILAYNRKIAINDTSYFQVFLLR